MCQLTSYMCICGSFGHKIILVHSLDPVVAQPPEDHNMELRNEHQVTSQSEDWDLQLSQSKDIEIRGQVSTK